MLSRLPIWKKTPCLKPSPCPSCSPPSAPPATATLRDTSAFDLAHHVVCGAAKDLDPARVDDVILGEGLYGGGVTARHVVITAGLAHLPGLANNRHCAAGQAAVQSAAASVRAGMDRLVVAGGVNSASTSPRSSGGAAAAESVWRRCARAAAWVRRR